MKWIDFQKVAFPMSLAEGEAARSFIYKANRWLGLRFAYLFYCLGFSANLLSALRVILAFWGFYLLSFAKTGLTWQPILGFFIIAWQVNLDFADGAIARAQSKSSDFGQQMDGLANVAARAAIIILWGYYTENILLIWVSVFSSLVLSFFWDSTANLIFQQGRVDNIRRIYRLSSSVFLSLIIVPLTMVILGIFDLFLKEVSCIVTMCYSALALLWLGLCCFKKA